MVLNGDTGSTLGNLICKWFWAVALELALELALGMQATLEPGFMGHGTGSAQGRTANVLDCTTGSGLGSREYQQLRTVAQDRVWGDQINRFYSSYFD